VIEASEGEDKTEGHVTAGWPLLQRKVQEHRVSQIFKVFRENAIEPILIKGLAAGRYYPKTELREFIDVDLAVAHSDYGRSEVLCRSAALDGLAVDLHDELRHLDTVSWNDLFANSELIDAENGTFRVLRREDHLRVLCVHWLTDGGSNRERLWDIYYAIANRDSSFDWDRFLNKVGKNRRRWLVCTLGLAHRYLGLDLSDTPIEGEAMDIPDWLIRTVEYEWSRKDRSTPLELALHDRKVFLKQIPMRFKQNPIWATIQMEGSFDAKTRVFYQIGLFFYRIPSSFRRVKNALAIWNK